MTDVTDADLERLLAGAAALAPRPEAGPPALDAAAEWFVARSGKALVLAVVALALYGIAVVAIRRLRRSTI